MDSPVFDYYRCPEDVADATVIGELSQDSGFFRFGPDTICYGRTSSGFRGHDPAAVLYDTLPDVACGPTLRLPFRPSEVIANLREERYASSNGARRPRRLDPSLRRAYYLARPLLPARVRRHLQRIALRGWERTPFPTWPVDDTVECLLEQLLILALEARAIDEVPFIWFWPDGAPSCAMMTHDVETASGRDFCSDLMDLDETFDIKSSFQIVPEGRYTVSEAFLDGIRRRGFEINIHDLNHDGSLFSDRARFLSRVGRINQYARSYGALGFRSGTLYRNPDWYDALDFSYDMSVPNVGHLEVQPGGCCSIMPFFIGKILELPVTITQDYTLFHILNQYSLDLWRAQTDRIVARHGLASFIIHPDYIRERRAQDAYRALLTHLARLRSEGQLWVALPRDLNQWWRERSQMRLSRSGNRWVVEGPGKARARIAYARLDRGRLSYHLDAACPAAAE